MFLFLCMIPYVDGEQDLYENVLVNNNFLFTLMQIDSCPVNIFLGLSTVQCGACLWTILFLKLLICLNYV